MLIIKCWMLKVKYLTPFKPKNWKKAKIFNKVDFNHNLVLYRMEVILGR